MFERLEMFKDWARVIAKKYLWMEEYVKIEPTNLKHIFENNETLSLDT